MGYDELVAELLEREKVEVVESNRIKPLKGLCIDNVLTLNPNIETMAEKKCVLAEEVGHYHLTGGNILNQKDIKNRRQERRAREWAYERLVPPCALLYAHMEGIVSGYDIAEFLDITEEFLYSALKYYDNKYGKYRLGNYLINFWPLFIINIKERLEWEA